MMNPELEYLYQQVKIFQTRILQIKQECTHQGATKIPKGDTGNYDPSNDAYWLECKCPICDSRWIEDQ